jgi:hypothetical protein
MTPQADSPIDQVEQTEIPLPAKRLHTIFIVKCREKSLTLSRNTTEEHADDTTKNKMPTSDVHNTGINDNQQ